MISLHTWRRLFISSVHPLLSFVITTSMFLFCLLVSFLLWLFALEVCSSLPFLRGEGGQSIYSYLPLCDHDFRFSLLSSLLLSSISLSFRRLFFSSMSSRRGGDQFHTWRRLFDEFESFPPHTKVHKIFMQYGKATEGRAER